MKLKSILKTLSAEALIRIQEHWGISPADLSACTNAEDRQEVLISNLYQRLQNRMVWDDVWKRLTPSEQNLVSFLTIHGGDLERGEVCSRFFAGDTKAMDKMVHSLAERGIVFYDDVPGISTPLTLVGIPEPFLRYIELPSFWEGYLGHFLKELSNNELKHVATQGLRLQPECAIKHYLIHLIRSALLDPVFLRRYVDRLTDGQKSVLQSMEERKGVCVYRDLLELSVQRRYDHSRGDSVQWLLNTSGLVFTAVSGANKYNNLLMIPRDVMYIINNHYEADTRTFQELDSVTVVERERSPSVILDNSNTLLRDLVAFCNVIDRHPVKVLATGGVGKNELKKVLPYLSRYKSPKYVEFLSLFAIQRKFLVSTGESYRVSHTFHKWLEDSHAAYRDLLSWWLNTTEWNEEFIDGNTVHVEPPVTGLINIPAVRRLVLEYLHEMPRDRWCLSDGFNEEVLPKLVQEIPGRSDPMQYDKHTRANDLVIESIMAESLHWLGLIAIGLRSETDVPIIGSRVGDGKTMKARGGSRGRPRKQPEIQYTFRCTDLGRFIFSRPVNQMEKVFQGADPSEVLPLTFDVDHFIVQPTHEVIVPPDLKLRTFYELNEIAEVKSIDVMSIVSITRSSIREGLDRGLRIEDIQHFLEKHSRTPLPDSLRVLMKECSEKHGQVNMGFAGGYIIMDDRGILEEVRGNRKVSPHIKEVIDDKVVLLKADVDVKRLARELQKIGFMPRLESQHVQVRDDELFHLALSREDMYTVMAAVRFALEARDERGRQIAAERLVPLLERLKPDARAYNGLNELAEPLVKTWLRAQEEAREAELQEVRKKYKKQLTQLVTTTAPKAPSKFQFTGTNPAIEPDDVRTMIEFAIDHEFEVEIDYRKTTNEEVTELIAPESLERDRVYAHCRNRDAYSVYRVDRVLKAKLV